MKVIGIDPGYDRCGWAVVEQSGNRYQALDCGCWQTNRQDDKWHRYDQLRIAFAKLIDQYQPEVMAIESLYFSRNVSTALPVSEVRGLLFGLALAAQIPIVEYTPATVKLAVTGYGRADKTQVTKMVILLLKLAKTPLIDDTGDALAVALTHLLQHRPDQKL